MIPTVTRLVCEFTSNVVLIRRGVLTAVLSVHTH